MNYAKTLTNQNNQFLQIEKAKKMKSDIKNIEYLYWEKKLSLKEIAERCEVCATTIRKAMVKNNIPRRPSKKKELIRPSKSYIKKLYCENKLTIEKIAERIN